MVVLAGGVGAWVVIQGSTGAVTFPPNEVYLEPVGVVEYAFTPSLLASAAMHEPRSPTTFALPGAAEVAVVKGSDELNYAAVRGRSECDAGILLDYLRSESAVSQAWADAQGIESEEVVGFVADLTPMLLTQDVRVTTHVLDDNRVVPRQALLERGTAVLVGSTGDPRVRCASGSPLNLAVAVATPIYVGVAWPGFDPAALVEIEPCDEPLTQFVLQDIATGEAFVRSIGSDVVGDSDATVLAGTATTRTATSTTTTVATTTTAATTTTLPVADYNATGEGTVTASSRLCGSYAATKAVDGDVTTSWISSSGDGAFSTFEWTGAQDEFIGAVTMVSNAENGTPRRRTDHGFAAVTIQVVDDSGEIVYEERLELPGTPDPDVTVQPNVVGRSVRLLLEGHENSSGAGFSELTIMVAR